uniref:Secreted protein n=1 Tax=Romanomermis culicivorax TaxID=13658 RepID=A0A915JNU2_ROMCU
MWMTGPVIVAVLVAERNGMQSTQRNRTKVNYCCFSFNFRFKQQFSSLPVYGSSSLDFQSSFLS